MSAPNHPLISIGLTVNGAHREASVEPRTSLADLLREAFLLTGTHVGCEHGVCGACTVLLDGKPVRACITLAAAASGRVVTTIEGLEGPDIEALREAFSAEHGLQCGFCTPAMIIAAADLLRRKPHLSAAEIRREMSGNLCRCTGYVGIVKAIARAAERLPETTDRRRAE
jgi:carbon-monoxide dehydrogenase small subunit